MNNNETLNKHYEAIAWGAALILLGCLNLIPGEQNDLFVLGVGIILLGLNLARFISKISVNDFTISLGIVASVLGMIAVLRPVLNVSPIELFSFPVFLLLIGVYLLIPTAKRTEIG